MNTTGPVTESSADANQCVAPPSPSPNLLGPTIFVYIISILAGLAAGGIIASISWSNNNEILNWPDVMGFVALFAGPFGGLVAAWFWSKRMTRHVRNYRSPRRLALYGFFWGLIAGWLAAIILWLIEGLLLAGIAYKYFWMEIPVAAGVGIAYCGSIGGLGAGIICGVVWAVWTKPITYNIHR